MNRLVSYMSEGWMRRAAALFMVIQGLVLGAEFGYDGYYWLVVGIGLSLIAIAAVLLVVFLMTAKRVAAGRRRATLDATLIEIALALYALWCFGSTDHVLEADFSTVWNTILLAVAAILAAPVLTLLMWSLKNQRKSCP